jgi:hypothetical protein
VCGQWLLEVAGVCISRIDKGFSVPCIAHYYRVLRAGWGQTRVKSAWITPRRFLCKPVVASSRGYAQSRRRSPPTREFHLPVCRAPPPIHHSGYPCRANTHVALASMHRSGAKGSTVDPRRRCLQTAGYRLPRIPLPRTPVNKAVRCTLRGVEQHRFACAGN